MPRLRCYPSTVPTAEQLPNDDPAWAAFVESHPDALPFHHPRWVRVIAGTYGFEASVSVIRGDDGTIAAGAPVVRVRRPLGARRLVSLPFTDYCPPLLAPGVEMGRMLEALERHRQRDGAERVEIRAEIPGAALHEAAGYRHVLALDGDYERVFAGFHPSQVKRNIRRAHAGGMEIRVSTPDDDLVGAFYRLHVETRRRLGVPVQPRRFFDFIRRHMIGPEVGWVVASTVGGHPVAAALFLASPGTVVYKYGASDSDAWQLRPNHRIFEHAIRAACEAGYTSFDFGRTDADAGGLRAFKSGWGAIETPLMYSRIGPVLPSRTADEPRESDRAAKILGSVIRRSPQWVCRAAGELLYRFAA